MSAASRRVVLGVTGSIAAYKAAELIRLLRKAGVEVHVIMTRAGREFITPLTLGTLSENPVTTDMFAPSAGGPYMEWGQTDGGRSEGAEIPDRTEGTPGGAAESGSGGAEAAGSVDANPTAAAGPGEVPGGDSRPRAGGAADAGVPAAGTPPAGARGTGGIRHIQVSRESDLIVVAPASGNILGKVAHGIADDALSTAIMASSAPVLFAPAMNTRMWEGAAVQENVQTLLRRGYRFVQPGAGDLACGEIGTGRMADPHEIAAEILRLLAPPHGLHLLVTTGRTEEPIDPVRVLSNRSSGRMGYAVAAAGRDLGFEVTVIAGATSVEAPAGIEVVPVSTAAEMQAEVLRRHGEAEILVMAAAVADYRAAEPAGGKIPGGQEGLILSLIPNDDILASLRGHRAGRVTVGFALEPDGGLERAEKKLKQKGCDLMVYNNPLRTGSEFGGETNEVTILYRDGRREPFPLMTKYAVGVAILRRAAVQLQAAMAARGARPAEGERSEGETGAAAPARSRTKATRGRARAEARPHRRTAK